MMTNEPDFSQYSYNELLDVRAIIDEDRFPERVQQIDELLKDPNHLIQEREIHENTMLRVKYSTFWRRFFANTIDGLIFIPILLIESRLFNFEFSSSNTTFQMFNSIQFVIYVIVMHGLCGQTIGKMICNVKVVDHDTERDISMTQSIKRSSVDVFLTLALLISITALTTTNNNDYKILLGVGIFSLSFASIAWALSEFISMLFNKKRRALHDFIGQTVVIRE